MLTQYYFCHMQMAQMRLSISRKSFNHRSHHENEDCIVV